jgi:hypothetical protein
MLDMGSFFIRVQQFAQVLFQIGSALHSGQP